MIVKLPAIFSKVTSRADKSYKLEFETRELSGNDASILLEQLQQEGYLLYSPNNDITEKDIPEVKADPLLDNSKSPQQRLRDRLFVYYKEKNGKTDGFQYWYENELNRIGQVYLDKIN